MATERIHPAFERDVYVFRRKVFRIFGGHFQVYDEHGTEILHSEQARFRLREDFRVFSSDSNQELLKIKTPQILDLGATYYVEDSTTRLAVGALRRKFLKSMFKDEWVFLSANGQEIGKLAESSWIRALLSRRIGWITQNYHVYPSAGPLLATIHQHFNPFVLKYTMTIMGSDPEIDRRLLIAAGILLSGIERRQR